MEVLLAQEVFDPGVAAEDLLEQGDCAQEWHRTLAQACRQRKVFP